MFGFWKNGKVPTAAVFVDYEHWYYGYRNSFQMKPNIEEWVKELENEYVIRNLSVFGDFSRYNIGMDMDRLKGITKNVVHTASDKNGVDKDFTDVIILDAIYRSAAKKKSPDVYVLFTGDAHFTKVVKYLKEINKKVVIYGVKYGFSNQLKSEATSYVEMPRKSQEKNHYNDLILTSLARLRHKPRTMVTYWKTINSVADYNHVPNDKVKAALDNLLKQKYLYIEEEIGYSGQVISVLKADWGRLATDGLWCDKTKEISSSQI